MSVDAPAEPPPSEVDPLVGKVLAGRYRIDRLLGAGGMGAVYRAEHIHMRKAVALKVLHREMMVMSEVVARFEREAVAAARIEHPNVAAATDFGRLEDGAFYLVLEFVEGKSLTGAIEAAGTFTPLRAVHVARQIAEALAAAHAAGVVHRDLKPDNVMLVEREGDREFAKVLDFGIAKLHTEESSEDQPVLTQAGSVFGTPAYMSPEQAKGDPVDARSDLYTLGMILYEMLSGQTAFVAAELIAILTKTLTEEPPPLADAVPAPLRDLVMRLLQKDPGGRVQTAEELARELWALEHALSPAVATTPIPASGFVPRSDAPVAASLSGGGSGVTARALALAARAKTELPILMKRRVPLGKRDVALWTIAAPATALGLVLTLAVASAGGSEKEAGGGGSLATEAKRLATAVFDPELAKLTEKAKSGDREALGALRKRVEKDGGGAEWMALGRGYAEIRHYSASAESYGRAVRADASLTKDEKLLSDLRGAAEDRDAFEKALDIALSELGQTGADLIYAVYKENSGEAGMTSVVAYAKKLIQKDEFEKNASEALKVALELDRAKVCSDYKEILPRAVEFGDSRSEKKLKSLNSTRGCGFLGVQDCYPCLRSGSELKGALEAVGKREAPKLSRAGGAGKKSEGK